MKVLNLFDIAGIEIMVRSVNNFIDGLEIDRTLISKRLKISSKNFTNYKLRDSYPLNLIKFILKQNNLAISNLPKTVKIGVKRDNVNINPIIEMTDDLLEVIGLYIAEGYARKNTSKKGLYQISIATIDKYLQQKIILGRGPAGCPRA